MLSEIEVRRQPGCWALVIPATTTSDMLGTLLAELLPEVFVYALSSGAGPAGPAFTRYLAWNPDGSVELEAGLPVLRAVPDSGRIRCVEYDEMLAAIVVHTGPYEELGEAYAALGAWVKANGRETAGPCVESYLTDPAEATDPAQRRTEVLWPVRDVNHV